MRFLSIAKGSVVEFITQTYVGREIGYISDEPGKLWVKEAKEIAAMLAGLARSIQSRKEK